MTSLCARATIAGQPVVPAIQTRCSPSSRPGRRAAGGCSAAHVFPTTRSGLPGAHPARPRFGATPRRCRPCRPARPLAHSFPAGGRRQRFVRAAYQRKSLVPRRRRRERPTKSISCGPAVCASNSLLSPHPALAPQRTTNRFIERSHQMIRRSYSNKRQSDGGITPDRGRSVILTRKARELRVSPSKVGRGCASASRSSDTARRRSQDRPRRRDCSARTRLGPPRTPQGREAL